MKLSELSRDFAEDRAAVLVRLQFVDAVALAYGEGFLAGFEEAGKQALAKIRQGSTETVGSIEEIETLAEKFNGATGKFYGNAADGRRAS